MENNRETYYRALRTRDKRFDGKFFTGVLTTGIFCRPICPARTPKKQNCQFYPTATAAMARGFALIKIDSTKNLEEVEQVLCQLSGVGPWTAQYIAMRALGYPDAFPVGDLGLILSLKMLNPKVDSNALTKHAEHWRPWRAYAAMHLWTGAT